MDRQTRATVVRSCRSLYPPVNPDDDLRKNAINLPDEEFTGITGRGSYSDATTFAGQLHNGTGYHLTEVGIAIETYENGDTTVKGYSTPVDIKPLSAGPFSFEVLERQPNTGYKWVIGMVKGYPRDDIGN